MIDEIRFKTSISIKTSTGITSFSNLKLDSTNENLKLFAEGISELQENPAEKISKTTYYDLIIN